MIKKIEKYIKYEHFFIVLIRVIKILCEKNTCGAFLKILNLTINKNRRKNILNNFFLIFNKKYNILSQNIFKLIK